MIPDGTGSVVEADVAEPAPAAGEVVVTVEAYSVNRGETFLLEAPPRGWRPGKDVAGVVASVGPGVHGLEVGQPVVAHPEHSGWAERVAVAADRLAPRPADMPATVAAALPLAGLTALRLVRLIGALPGRSILLTGASGGVGHYFVELATGLGARITALTASRPRGRRLAELGAEVLTDLTAARGGYDVVVESVGGAYFMATWRLLDPHGLFVWMGQASRERPLLDFFDWTGGTSATLRRFDYTASPVSVADDLVTLLRLVHTGRLHPELGLVAEWENTPEVLADLIRRRVRGNAVLEVTS
ncbi:oxidoreductase [Flexivirga endophytica]|uniref:Oxidoreductase n=1 Tax=Flexivirga endophytica TaxID=1849103 RepID=A0A916T671_9MICO|nr:zinc-binding dehydrogenase [Flexivirga endophytica]GGB32309.1 oxidoreductase [Flexivirga endophytica]GHB53197.1 oxidoreductase [Flexivirga endophytica]